MIELEESDYEGNLCLLTQIKEASHKVGIPGVDSISQMKQQLVNSCLRFSRIMISTQLLIGYDNLYL